MELIPAIDLLGGRVVRLSQGDFDRSTTYGDDPLEVARRWEAEGATRLHLVDLDGAKAGRSVQGDIVRSIVDAVAIPCQVAGGLRTEEAAGEALGWGADRVVMGSALLGGPDLARGLVDRHGPERLVAAIDVRDGMAIGSGWVAGAAGRPLGDVLLALRAAGVQLFAVTAIARDGLLEGPDLGLLDQVSALVGASRVIASAGVGSADDVRRLAARGFCGAILGRALYEGRLALRDAAIAASGGN